MFTNRNDIFVTKKQLSENTEFNTISLMLLFSQKNIHISHIHLSCMQKFILSKTKLLYVANEFFDVIDNTDFSMNKGCICHIQPYYTVVVPF